MAPTTVSAFHDEKRHSRFTEEMFSTPWPHHPEPKPDQNNSSPQKCPFCEQLLPHARSSILSVFCSGIRRLTIAICMILGAAIRCARLAVAGSLCLIGVIGACCRSLGVRIAHPEDRRFFAKPQRPFHGN